MEQRIISTANQYARSKEYTVKSKPYFSVFAGKMNPTFSGDLPGFDRQYVIRTVSYYCKSSFIEIDTMFELICMRLHTILSGFSAM